MDSAMRDDHDEQREQFQSRCKSESKEPVQDEAEGENGKASETEREAKNYQKLNQD